MKKDELKMSLLDNAGDDELEKLAGFSSSDKKTMRRIFEMSEKKYDMMKNSESSDKVQGVEMYRRSRWTGAVGAAAAALVLIAGGAGLYKLMDRNAPEDIQSSNIESSVSEEVTEEATEAPTEVPTEAENDEKCEAARQLVCRYAQLNEQNAPDPQSEQLILYYKDEYMTENGMDPEFADTAVDIDGKIFLPWEYCRVAQQQYSRSELRAAYGEVLTDVFLDTVISCDDVGATVEEAQAGLYIDSTTVPVFEEVGGVMFSKYYELETYDPADAQTVREKIFPVNDSIFLWEGVYAGEEDYEVVNAVIADEGEGWKIAKILHNKGGYDPEDTEDKPILLGMTYDLLMEREEAGELSVSDIDPYCSSSYNS